MQEHWVVQIHVPDGEAYRTELALHSVWGNRFHALDAAAEAESSLARYEEAPPLIKRNSSGYPIQYHVDGALIGGIAIVQQWHGEDVVSEEEVMCKFVNRCV